MIVFRILGGAALLALTGLGLSSCLQAPDYSTTPAIDFKELRIAHLPAAGGLNAVDTLKFYLNFRDGDGDLGLSAEDIKVAPWNSITGGPNNKSTKLNYFIQPFRKDNTGRFVPFINVGGVAGEYDGRFLRLDAPDAKPSPLRGELRYKLPLTLDGSPFAAKQVFRFEISIVDRALHESNKITTTEVTLGR